MTDVREDQVVFEIVSALAGEGLLHEPLNGSESTRTAAAAIIGRHLHDLFMVLHRLEMALTRASELPPFVKVLVYQCAECRAEGPAADQVIHYATCSKG
jgi:hypothetical protein